jgi:protein TonB
MTSADTKPAPLPKLGPSDRLGAIVTVTATSALDGADLTNVIVLSRRRSPSGIDAPAVKISDDERPAPWLTWSDRTPWTALIAGVLLLHLVIVAIFMRDPAPMQSLALDSISVDIVLGGQTEAGIAQMPSPAESAPSQPAESTPKPAEPEQPTETAEQAKPDLRPRLDDTRESPREAPQPQEPKTEERQTAAVQAEAEPTPVPEEAEPTPTVAETPPPPDVTEPKPVEEPVASRPPPPQEQPTETPREQSKPTPPRVAASRSGVGLGSSREVRDWASRVTAQLARNKRYPGDALAGGIGGTAVIAFAIDSAGNVGAVRLVRSSGNASLDRESRDLVRRAAPFPIPPQGKASITVPVNFNVLTGR